MSFLPRPPTFPLFDVKVKPTKGRFLNKSRFSVYSVICETYLNSLLGLRLAMSGTGGVSSTMSKLESSSAPETFNIPNQVKRPNEVETQNNISTGSEILRGLNT